MRLTKTLPKTTALMVLAAIVLSVSLQGVSAGTLDTELAQLRGKATSLNSKYSRTLDQYERKIIGYEYMAGGDVSIVKTTGANIDITTPDIKALYIAKIATAKDDLTDWFDYINDQNRTLSEAQTKFDEMADTLKINEVIIPMIKTASGSESLFKSISELEDYNNTLLAIKADFASFFTTPGELESSINAIENGITSIQSKADDLNTERASIIPITIYNENGALNTTNPAAPTLIKSLSSKTKSVYSNIRKAKSFYRSAYRGVSKLYLQAARSGLVLSGTANLATTNSSEYDKYIALYNKYSQKASSTCYEAQKDADNGLYKISGYQGKIAALTNISVPLESLTTNATAAVSTARATIEVCEAATFNEAYAADRAISTGLNDFYDRYKTAYSINKTQSRVNTLAVFTDSVTASANATISLKDLVTNSGGVNNPVFTTEIPQIEAITTAMTDPALFTPFNECKAELEDMIIDPAIERSEMRSKLSLCGKEYSNIKKIVSPAQRQWYKFIIQAAESGAEITDELALDLKAAKSFEKFLDKRESYQASANRIINKRIDTINSYQDKTDVLAASMPTPVIETLTSTASTFRTKIEGLNVTLEESRTTMMEITDYSDLRQEVRDIKNMNIREIVLPAQKALIKLFYEQYKYDLLTQVAVALNDAISADDFDTNPEQESLTLRITAINENLATLSSDLGEIQTNLDTIINDPDTSEELMKTTKYLQSLHTKTSYSIKKALRQLHKDYLTALRNPAEPDPTPEPAT